MGSIDARAAKRSSSPSDRAALDSAGRSWRCLRSPRHQGKGRLMIFKRAVRGMGDACERVLREAGVSGDQVDLVIPHQANLRIIDSTARKLEMPLERVVEPAARVFALPPERWSRWPTEDLRRSLILLSAIKYTTMMELR